MKEPLLVAQDIAKHYHVASGLIFSKAIGVLKAVDGVSFTIGKGETFGLVGESGCGKTTTSKLVLMLEQITSGTVLFNGKDITHLSGGNLKEYRRMVQAVFQSPFGSLSPRMKVGNIIAEPLRANKLCPKIRFRRESQKSLMWLS
jgi:oligopeptide transport system ATP-binding protein